MAMLKWQRNTASVATPTNQLLRAEWNPGCSKSGSRVEPGEATSLAVYDPGEVILPGLSKDNMILANSVNHLPQGHCRTGSAKLTNRLGVEWFIKGRLNKVTRAQQLKTGHGV
jgi:hypothetical protein